MLGFKEIEEAYQKGMITQSSRDLAYVMAAGDIPEDAIPVLLEAAVAPDLDGIVMSWCAGPGASYEATEKAMLERYNRGQARIRALGEKP